MQCCLKRSMAQSKLINKGCYISNTSKRKILSALTEDRSMTCVASIDRFHMVQMLTRSFNIFRIQIMKQFNKSSREYKLLKSPWKLYLMGMTGLIGLTLKIISLRNMLS